MYELEPQAKEMNNYILQVMLLTLQILFYDSADSAMANRLSGWWFLLVWILALFDFSHVGWLEIGLCLLLVCLWVEEKD